MSLETGPMAIQSAGETPRVNIPGIKIHSKPCAKCGSKMMIIACPCFLKKHGWNRCARCLNTKCAAIIGIEKKRRK